MDAGLGCQLAGLVRRRRLEFGQEQGFNTQGDISSAMVAERSAAVIAGSR